MQLFKNNKFYKSTLTISFCTFLSRIFGFLRDLCFAKILGAGLLSDVFFAAFKLPNTFRRIFAEGTMSNVFVPILSQEISAKKELSYIKRFSGGVYLILMLLLVIITLVCQLFMEDIIIFINSGFVNSPHKIEMTVKISRITFLFLFFISITAFLGSVLNSFGHFWYYAITPVIFNIILISTCFVVYITKSVNIISILSYGLVVSGVIQFLFMYFACKKYKSLPNIKNPIFNDKTKILFKNFLPSFITNGILQINIFVDSIFASKTESVLSYLYYADRLAQMPISLIGYSISVSMLPLLSRATKEKEYGKIEKLNINILKLISFLTIPVSMMLIFASKDVIRLVYYISKFNEKDIIIIGNTLAIYGISIPFMVLNKVLNINFFANLKLNQPLYIGLLSLFLNILFNVFFIQYSPIYSVIISTTLASVLSTLAVCLLLLKSKTHNFKIHFFINTFHLKVLIFSIFSVLEFFFFKKIFPNYTISILVSFILAIISYLFFSYIFLLKELSLNS